MDGCGDARGRERESARAVSMSTSTSTIDFFAVCDGFRMPPPTREAKAEAADDDDAPTVGASGRRMDDDDGDGDDARGAVRAETTKRVSMKETTKRTSTTTTTTMMRDVVDDETFEEALRAMRAWRADEGAGARVDEFHSFLVHDLNGRRDAGFQCLVAALMSVQCLDKVALRAFERLRELVPDGEVTVSAIREASTETLEEACKTLNLWTSKVKYIKQCADVIHYRFRGRVPRTVGALKTLPGVGDKLAHLLSSVSFCDDAGGEGDHFAGVVVDTHVKRVSRRLGWARASDDPERVRLALQARVQRDDWQELSLDLIALGQNYCASTSPSCGACPVRRHCPSATEGR